MGGILVTMDDHQASDMVALVAPPLAIPVHYNDYTLFRSPLSDFLDEFRRRQLPGEVRIVARGGDGHVAHPAAPRVAATADPHWHGPKGGRVRRRLLHSWNEVDHGPDER